MEAPILDLFDDEGLINKESYINQSKEAEGRVEILKEKNIDTCLFIFSREPLDFLENDTEEFYIYKNASNLNKVYIYKNKFLIAYSPLGSNCAGGMMEELGFFGIKNFFSCGSAGQIDHSKSGSAFIAVEKAIRDEGASYHYLAPSVYAETDKELTDLMIKYLEKKNFEFIKGTTWTTDAFYRETQKAIDKRLSQGAVCVEMECAGWCAIAKFRGYKFAQLLYFSDAVKQSGWKWKPDKKELKDAVIKLMLDFVSEFCENK